VYRGLCHEKLLLKVDVALSESLATYDVVEDAAPQACKKSFPAGGLTVVVYSLISQSDSGR
jgi:hypothetical protein